MEVTVAISFQESPRMGFPDTEPHLLKQTD